MDTQNIEIVLKYIHFVCIFVIVGSLIAEFVLLGPRVSRKELARISRIDGLYGLASMILLAAGLSLWFWVGKPADYYSKNPLFLMKIGLFILIGLLSIKPTIFFIKERKGDAEEEVEIPRSIRTMLRMEIIILFMIPIFAVMMAKGIGL